jgi:LPS export ABC transporter permease LptG
LRIPVPRPKLLDWYVSSLFVKVVGLAFFGLLGIFYISTFIDLSDKLFKGTTTGATLLQYLYFATPQFVLFIVPLSVLITAMVVIGVITKNSELIVMKACGISLYRAAAPLLVFAVLASALMFLLQEQVLAYANRRAEAIRHEIRGGSPRTFDVVNRKWLVARNGDIYNYLFYDPSRRELNGLSIFQFDAAGAAFAARTYVAQAAWDPDKGPSAWRGKSGWIREFTAAGETKGFDVFPARDLRLEPPDYFATESPDADRMSYVQLRRYISDLRASGFNVVPQTVALHRKISFPFVTLIMTLIAVPFAVTTGRRGALYGIAVGIVLAVVYWLTTNAFGAIGSAGMLAPVLAAWAPNLIFGAGAAYLLLTVRT